MAASYQRLVPILEAMRSLLRSEEESFFADWIDKDIALLRREDPEGVRHFLAAFGGMGSLNDVTFSRPDDGPVGRWRGARRYRRFRELAEAGWSLARELEAQTTQPPLVEGRRGSY